MVHRTNIHFRFVLVMLLFFIGCNQPVDMEGKEQLSQLLRFSEKQSVQLSRFDYVLIEGQIKCKGCAEVWPRRISSGLLNHSSVLVIGGDSTILSEFDIAGAEFLVTSYDSIEHSFPYIANYFLFYRRNGEFSGHVELGARNIQIPESTK